MLKRIVRLLFVIWHQRREGGRRRTSSAAGSHAATIEWVNPSFPFAPEPSFLRWSERSLVRWLRVGPCSVPVHLQASSPLVAARYGLGSDIGLASLGLAGVLCIFIGRVLLQCAPTKASSISRRTPLVTTSFGIICRVRCQNSCARTALPTREIDGPRTALSRQRGESSRDGRESEAGAWVTPLPRRTVFGCTPF